jgi:beta-1,4-mannosyltransferase
MTQKNTPEDRIVHVVARPAFSNRDANPYNSLLYDAVTEDPLVTVKEHNYSMTPWAADIFHLHWPEFDVLPKSAKPYDLIKKVAVWIWILIAKLSGVKIVWTAHNAFGHDTKPTTLNKFLWKRFLHLLDGVVYLSEESKAIIERDFPVLQKINSTIIKHGHYGPWISNVRHVNNPINSDLNTILQSTSNDFLILNFGQMRSYKNVDELMRQFSALTMPGVRLMIAGNVPDPKYQDELKLLQKRDPRIILYARHLDDASLLACLKRANLVVLPYKKILNSGSALMALSLGIHVVVPAIGSMESLQKDVGKNAMTLYDGAFDSKLLEVLITRIKNKKNTPPDLTEYEWPMLGNKMSLFYKNLIK